MIGNPSRLAPHVQLVFSQTNVPRQRALSFRCRTDENGAYSVSLTAPDSYMVFLPLILQDESAAPRIQLTGLTADLKRDLHFLSAGELRIRCLDAAGTPVQGTLLRITRKAVAYQTMTNALSDNLGRWQNRVVAGDYQVTGWNPQRKLYAMGDVSVPEGGAVELILGLSGVLGSFRGQAIDAGSGAAVANATVNILPVGFHPGSPGYSYKTLSEENGSFDGPIPGPGDYYALITATDYIEARSAFRTFSDSVSASQVDPVIVRLQKGHHVDGIVVDWTGEPVPGCDVLLSQSDDEKQSRVALQSDAQGRFSYSGIPSGIVKLTASDSIAVSSTVEVSVPIATAVILRLNPASIINGWVRWEDGSRFNEQFSVLLVNSSGVSMDKMWTYPGPFQDGRFALKGIPPGNYGLTIYARGGKSGNIKASSAPFHVGDVPGSVLVEVVVRNAPP